MKYRMPLMGGMICPSSRLGREIETIIIKFKGDEYYGESCSCDYCVKSNRKRFLKEIKQKTKEGYKFFNMEPLYTCPSCEYDETYEEYGVLTCLKCYSRWKNEYTFSHTVMLGDNEELRLREKLKK